MTQSKSVTVREAIDAMAVHMANLYYYITREVIKDFGEDAKKSIERAIIEFGRERGRNIAKKVKEAGLPLTIENLDRFYDIPLAEGWNLNRTYGENCKHNITEGCTQAKVWLEKDWAEVGHIYCLVDFAIREGYSDNIEFQAVKNMLQGDPYCESHTVYKDISKKGL